MIKLTRKQREALFRVFQRTMPHRLTPTKYVKYPHILRNDVFPIRMENVKTFIKNYPELIGKTRTTEYRQLRKQVQTCFDKSGCVMVPWDNMWLGIETDGYVHS